VTNERAVPKQAILLVNTASRRGSKSFESAVAGLKAAGVELVEAIALDDPSRLDSAVSDAVARAAMVVIGGGDGTLSSAVDHFVGHETVLAILPLGTANSFARTLGIPLELEDAIDVIASGRCRRIDVGQINGDYFANTAVIGLSPLIADTIPRGLKRWLGRLAYLVWAFHTAVRFTPFRLMIETDDAKHRLWATEVRIANGRFFGGVEVVKGAELDDGQIVVQAVTGKSKLRLGASWLAALFRLGGSVGEVKEFRCSKFRIETHPTLDVAIDGETCAETPVIVTAVAAAVAVAVPTSPPA
jgi:YegS/Rv2252/BmrU family lipid kinase